MNALPDFAMNQSGEETRKRRKRPRHSHGRAEHSFWQFGAGILPPAALLGITFTLVSWIKPELGATREVRICIYALLVICSVGLGTIFYGMRRGSRRLERREVWIAMILGILTLLALLSTQFKGKLLPKAGNASSIAGHEKVHNTL